MKKEKRLKGKYIQLRALRFGLKLFLISSVMVIVACQDVKKPLPPENLISKEKMATILVEVYTINAARNVNNKLLINLGVKLDSIIYEKYNIDSLQFVESNNYYSSNLTIYSEIINDTKDQLTLINQEKDSIYDLIKKEKGDTLSYETNISNKLIAPKKSKAKDSIQLKSLK